MITSDSATTSSGFVLRQVQGCANKRSTKPRTTCKRRSVGRLSKPSTKRPVCAATEHEEQVSLFQWAELAAIKRPALGLMFAIPNGGKRHKATAAKLKAEGVKAGVPDIFLPVPVGAYHGLWIELKTQTGKPSPKQQVWLKALAAQGYQAAVCYGWMQARQVLLAYLNGDYDESAE